MKLADVIIKENAEIIGNYREFKALNYSTLSQLSSNPKYTNVEKSDTSYYVLGRYTEDIFMGVDINSKYAINNLPPITGQMETYLNAMIKYEGDFDKAYEEVEKANNGVKVRTNKEDFKLKFLEGDAFKTYKFHKDIIENNKTLISKEDALLGNKLAISLETNSFIRNFRNNPNRYKIYYQVPLIATLPNGRIGKCLVDVLVVDEEEDIIYPIDIKTTSDSLKNFKSTVKKYRYDLQASFYFYIISSSFPNHTISNFCFLVSSTETPDISKGFTISIADIYYGRAGFTSPYGFLYKGWEQLVEEYVLHEASDFWELPVELWEDVIELNIYE